jgi:hypothetical protein
MIFFVILLASMCVSLVVQHFIGPLPSFGARVRLMPIVMFYGPLALPRGALLGLAFAGGLMWRPPHALGDSGGVEIAMAGRSCFHHSWSAHERVRPLFQRGRWEDPLHPHGICTSAIVLAEYLMISIRRQPVIFVFNEEIWCANRWRRLAAMFFPLSSFSP